MPQRSRAVDLACRLAALEARLMERTDQLEREIKAMREQQLLYVRAQAQASVDLLREYRA